MTSLMGRIGMAVLAAGCWQAEAMAQDAAGSASDSAPATAASPDAPADGEIVVTAQRRSERLQDVPIAVSAITAAQSEQLGIRTLGDIQILTPGASFGDGYTFAQ